MIWQPENTAPINVSVLVYGAGGIRLGLKDTLGNWRGRHGGTVKHPPSHWMNLPEGPKS